jgi:hypothetical protein
VLHESGGDFRDQGFEAFVVAILAEVQFAMALHDPADVAGPMLAQDHGSGFGRSVGKRVLYRIQCRQESFAAAAIQRTEHGLDLLS